MSDYDDSGPWWVTPFMYVLVGLLGLGGFAAFNFAHDFFYPPKKTETATIPAVVSAPKCASEHRFERLEVYPMNLRADIALDSCTGQICRTWDWAPKNQRTETAWNAYANRPLCADLSASNP